MPSADLVPRIGFLYLRKLGANLFWFSVQVPVLSLDLLQMLFLFAVLTRCAHKISQEPSPAQGTERSVHFS
jgi:hypothetical protein